MAAHLDMVDRRRLVVVVMLLRLATGGRMGRPCLKNSDECKMCYLKFQTSN